MRQVALAALSVFAALLMGGPAHAAASPDTGDIIDALHGAPVYIAPGTEGTNNDTAALLEGQMHKGDSIVIVMLPSDANTSQEELQHVTQQISDALGKNVVVGVSVGSTYDATGPSLPAGTADELMGNAETVSQSPIDTMGTFIRNVHDWEQLHPEQVKTSHEAASHPAGFNPAPLVIGGVLGVLLVVSAGVVIRRRRKTQIHDEVQFNAPHGVGNQIKALMELRSQLLGSDFTYREEPRGRGKNVTSQPASMADALQDVCKYTEAYFSRLHPDKRLSSTVRDTYIEHLETIQSVVKRYIDITLHPEYYDTPDADRQNGLESVQGFAEFALKCIRQNNRTAMTDYTVGTKILSAQRYR